MTLSDPDTQSGAPRKGLPGSGSFAGAIGSVVFDDCLSPLMVLKSDALEHNIAEMAAYCTDKNVLLAPHGKTTMSPQVFWRQLAAGAWAMTAATGSHVRTYRSFGVRRILLANELIDSAAIAWIADDIAAHPEVEFICYVDSTRGIDVLVRALAAAPQTRVDVLVEVGHSGGRTGCRSVEEARAVARSVASKGQLRLRGVAGYEGGIGHDREPATLAAIATFCAELAAVANAINDEGLFADDVDFVVISAGGSAYFDIVVEELSGLVLHGRPSRVVLRSGSYVSHDHGLYARISPFSGPRSRWNFRPALEIWGRVLSRPEPGIAYADFGRRDAPFDQDLPTPLTVRSVDGSGQRTAAGVTVAGLNDQHAFLTLPDQDPLAPGDWIGCGISHPCTAFDKWRSIPIVDETYRVVDLVNTYF